MHFYGFNVGNYCRSTSGLTLMEDLAHRRLLDRYYLSEKPLEGDPETIARRIGLTDYLDEVKYVLEEFFPKEGENWVNLQCEIEIEKYHSHIASSSKGGINSGISRKKKASQGASKSSVSEEGELEECSTVIQGVFKESSRGVQATNNQEPRTKNQEPTNNIAATSPDGVVSPEDNVNGEVTKDKVKTLPEGERTKDKVKSLHKGEVTKDKVNTSPNGDSLPEQSDTAKGLIPNCPQKEIIRLFNTLVTKLDFVDYGRWCTEDRKLLRARWQQDERHQSLDFWKRFFEKIEESKQTKGTEEFPWTLSRILIQKNFNRFLDQFTNEQNREK